MVQMHSRKPGSAALYKAFQIIFFVSWGIMLKSISLLLQADTPFASDPLESDDIVVWMATPDRVLVANPRRRLYPDELYTGDGNTVVLSYNKETIPKEAIVKHYPKDNKVLVKRRTLLKVDAFYSRFYRTNDYATVYENYLPEPLAEAGVCRIGSKLYYLGGFNETKYSDAFANVRYEISVRGTARMSVYDMNDMSVTQGPKLPFVANHMPCAESPNGIIHVTGGFRQDAPKGKPKAFDRHWILDTNVPLSEAKWEQKARMPQPRGAHGCKFLRDGKMYCVGGGSDANGPFSKDLMIYDPENDSWKMGPRLHTGRDHISDPTTLYDGNALMVVGGRTHVTERIPEHLKHPYFITTAYSAEIYDLRTQKWSMVRSPATPREAISMARYKRHGDATEPSILLIGGEQFFGFAGHAMNSFDEFDPNTGLYHCHDPLPYPIFGSVVGVWKDKLHIVGGGEWIGFSATRRVVVLDLKKAPAPRNCYYNEKPVFNAWDVTAHQLPPFPGPGIVNMKDEDKLPIKGLHYDRHERMFKMGLLGPGRRKKKNRIIVK